MKKYFDLISLRIAKIKAFFNSKPISGILLLSLSLLLIALFCNVDEILTYQPRSMHIWRQADCLSLARNYSENLNFFEPAIDNYISEDRTSGKTVGEFPIVYYIVGAVWKYFGESIYFYRLLGFLVYCISIVYLYRSMILLTKNKFWSYFTAILLFTSPLLLYYSLSFLTNTFALSFILIGWFFAIKYLKFSGTRNYFLFTLFFTLAGLLKVTALLSVIAFSGGLILILLLNKKLNKQQSRFLLSVLISALIILFWFIWAESYNSKYGGKYTFNSIWPLWELDKFEVLSAVRYSKEFIYRQMLNPTTWSLIWVSFFLLILNIKRNLLAIGSLFFIFIGVILYCVLWFAAFSGHDYYVINLMILPVAIVAVSIYQANQLFPGALKAKFLKLAAVIFLLYNVVYMSSNIHMRFGEKLWNDDVASRYFMYEYEFGLWYYAKNHDEYKDLDKLKEYNRSIGIEKNDLIVYLPDETFNASLFLLEQKGWTSFGGDNTASKSGMEEKVEKGAKYLILANPEYQNKEYLQDFLHTPIGEFDGKKIYQLQ